MITEREQQATLLSATKKDFYQIWNELLETAGKLSERWDPLSTNESDPGIVLLKVLTAIADKLNYNIDKNTLEAFMPSAAQEESMRKLCDMMGYAMQYYRSATTDVTFYFAGNPEEWAAEGASEYCFLEIPAFTQVTNIDKDITYTTTEPVKFTSADSIKSVACIEGVLNFCEEDSDGIINYNMLDDNFRYYLPETQIAENGIFIYNITDGAWSTPWEQIKQGALSAQPLKQKIFKFGYDSKKLLPYIQFPDDISSLMEDGLRIAYIATNGISGNISARALSSFTTPTEWNLGDNASTQYNTTGISHTADEFKCYNASAATNGADKENLTSAYKNFKRTVGTFDTLVTCRDYMNSIYNLTISSIDTTPLVSNIVVSDIRDDLNKAITICSFDDFGISYKDTPRSAYLFDLEFTTTSQLTGASAKANYNKIAKVTANNKYYKSVKTGSDTYTWGEIIPDTDALIDNFDLVLYPYKTHYNLNTKSEYDSTFKYDASTFTEIREQLDLFKTVSHKLRLPDASDIVGIKNYLKLNAKIATTQRVNNAEWAIILDHIKQNIYKQFNLRQLTFSAEIPFEDILDAIQTADTMIKNVSLEDPEIYTAALLQDGREFLFLTEDEPEEERIKLIKKKYTAEERSTNVSIASKQTTTNTLYNKLVLRNVLSGRVELFNYRKNFAANFTENVLRSSNNVTTLLYPDPDAHGDAKIAKIVPELDINLNKFTADEKTNGYELKENQIIQFRAPNYRTTKTYPAYVNYFLKLNASTQTLAIPATFQTLETYMLETRNGTPAMRLLQFINSINHSGVSSYARDLTAATFVAETERYGRAFILAGRYTKITDTTRETVAGAVYDKTTGWWYIIDGSTKRYTSAGVENASGQYIKPNVGLDFVTANELIPIVPKTMSASAYKTRYVLYDASASGTAYRFTLIDNWEENNDSTVYVYPLNNDNYGVWYNWIKSRQEYGIALKGLYRNLGTDQSRLVGSMVDENKNKYQICTTWFSTTSSPLAYYHVQECHAETIASTQDANGITNWGVTTNGLGSDAVFSALASNSEYALKSGEYLCINYTHAESQVAEMSEQASAASIATTSQVINEYYGPGTIIKPNFNAMDSVTKHNSGTSYSKTSGYDFSADLGTNFMDQVPGLFAISPNEQIDIREKVSVFVYDDSNTQGSSSAPVYVYFNLLDESATDEVLFLGAAVTSGNEIRTPTSRTLQEGEYFWYTDKNKQTLTYCGAGCSISNFSTTAIKKAKTDIKVSTEQILEKGLSIVPWIPITGLFVSKNNQGKRSPKTTDRYIRWDEYQYITLADGDKIKEIKQNNSALTEINKTWSNCTEASYILQGVEQTLPILSTGAADDTWSVRTKLLVNMGPEKSQKLIRVGKDENLKIYESISVYNTPTSATPVQVYSDLSLKSNYVLNSSQDVINTTINLFDENGLLQTTLDDFTLKAFRDNEILLNSSEGQQLPVTLYNTDRNYTRLSFENASGITQATTPYTTLYCALPNKTKDYGLLMIYYKPAADTTLDPKNYPSIRFMTAMLDSGAYNNEADSAYYPVIFNYNQPDVADDLKNRWWEGHVLDGANSGKHKYALRPGINIIKISADNLRTGATALTGESFGCAINIYPAFDATNIQNSKDEIIFSPLDIIKMSAGSSDSSSDLGINLNMLGYFNTTASGGTINQTNNARAAQLLKDIAAIDIDNQFYYNAILDNSLKLDINEEAGETINSPSVWYDTNNVNNKFVLSEIDSDYLDTGITLARSSRK